jgi:glycosyltransferase involved in cell wall biosynthesis
MKPGITCVIPAHNEGAGIRETILEIDEFAPGGMPFTIFVSEDGSHDNTRSEVLEAGKLTKNSTVILASPADRLGYSKAVQRGILECNTELICFMDADGQCDPRDISRLLESLNNSGIVVGYRNPRADGFNRIAYSKLFGLVYRLFGGPKLIDPSSPFILAHTSEIQYLGNKEFHLSFGFWWEFQQRIAKQGLSVKQIPVTHRVRVAGETQVYTLRRLPKIVKTHLHGLWKLRKELENSK